MILQARSDDFNLQTRILLNAYTKTKEKAFYGLFYKHTYDYFFACASNLLERFHAPIDPHDLTSEAFMIIFNRLIENELRPIENPFGFVYCIMRNVINKHYREEQKTQPITSTDYNRISIYNKPLDTLIMWEEDKMKELRKAWVHNIINSDGDGLAKNERGILKDYYYNRIEIKEIARKNNVSVGKIYNIVYRSKEKIKRLAKSLISLSSREEEP